MFDSTVILIEKFPLLTLEKSYQIMIDLNFFKLLTYSSTKSKSYILSFTPLYLVT